MAQAQDRKIAAPPINPETQHFWDAASESKFLYKKCAACGEPHFYPRSHCPFCFSDRVEWREASGDGTIYTYSVMRRAPVPYAIAYVELAEGPRIMSNIVDCDLDQIKIGQKVRLVFQA
ncbi:MAG TPA: Zn-ribbon domain-containing OB-fold protein, partial [Stellaceae bacterium]|nr:Zn-ribbon domain-containing OB-fold protein [Stellaceae bacterium]